MGRKQEKNTRLNKNLSVSGSKRYRAVALIFVLFVVTFLFILGSYMQNTILFDLHFLAVQKAREEAFYLAKAGMEYYANNGIPGEPISVPLEDPRHTCEIMEEADGDLTFRGIVKDGGMRIIAERTLVVPHGVAESWFERK